jgi:hypothetical protein
MPPKKTKLKKIRTATKRKAEVDAIRVKKIIPSQLEEEARKKIELAAIQREIATKIPIQREIVTAIQREIATASAQGRSATTQEAAAATYVLTRGNGCNLKTLPPLMLHDTVRPANVCTTTRDAYHDAESAHSIQSNELFKRAQKLMFGDNWAAVCQRTFGSQIVSDNVNGTWLNAPHGDILWTRVAEIKQHCQDHGHGHGLIVPRFGMRLEPYNLENCIRTVTDEDRLLTEDDEKPFLFYIVDNLDASSPTHGQQGVRKISHRCVTTSEVYDRAGRSIRGINRLERLMHWWGSSVHGADPRTDRYPPIIIPLDLVGEIDIGGSVLEISLFRDNLARFGGFKSEETERFEGDPRRGPATAVLLYRFYIPGVTVDGVPGVVNSGSLLTDSNPMFTYDTYVFIHTNGSVSYSAPVNGCNYPDNAEKNLFYSTHRAPTAAAAAADAADDINRLRQAILYNICKSIGDSGAVWTASGKTFIHTTDTGLILRCMFNGRYCVINITFDGVTRTFLVSPDIAEELFSLFGIPTTPRPVVPDITPAVLPSFAELNRQHDELNRQSDELNRQSGELNQTTNALQADLDILKLKVKNRYNQPKPRRTKTYTHTPLSATLRDRGKFKPNYKVGGSGDGIQQGGALFTVPDNTPTTTKLSSLLGNANRKVIFKGNQITDLNKTLHELEINSGSKLMLFEKKTPLTAPSQINPAPPLLKISSDACRYFQTLLLYITSFYSDTPADAGGIDNFALPESKDVVVVFTDDVSKSGVSNVVANPFQDSAATKPVVKFFPFTELPSKIQEFLTFLKAFVKVFVSNIALITDKQIHPKPRVMPETPTTSSVEGDMERKLNLIRTIISNILGNKGGDSDGGDRGDDSGVNGIQTDLREVSRACLLPSVLLRIDDPNIKKGYLDAYNTSKASKASNTSTLDSASSNDLGVPNFFYLPNATSNVFDIVDNIVEYFGPVFTSLYHGDDIVFEKFPVILPEVKAGVVEALEQFKRDNSLYTIPTQIKFNTHAVSSEKIFDNICEIINGKPLSDPLNATLKQYVEKRLSAEIEKLKTLAVVKKEGDEIGKSGESGEGDSSLSEEIHNNIEATARDNVLSAFITEMANYFVDGEMEDFEKDSLKALIDLNATYGFDVQGNDYLHLNDIIYKIFVQEIMYTGAHIYRVDFLQDFINNIGFNTGQLNYLDNINDALAANGTISNEQLMKLKIKGYSLSDIIGLLYELRDKTTDSSSEEEVTSIINGFFGQEVSSLPKVMKTGIDIGSIPSQPITVKPASVPVATGGRGYRCGRGGHKNNKKTNNKYDTKRRAMYKKFVDKYIILDKKHSKRDNSMKGTRKNKKMNASATTRKNINKKSYHYVKDKNAKKARKKNKKVKHRSNLYKMYKRNKTLRHD